MIYDTFMFFNELELLELRLNELSQVVDKFVLVEATRTFTNKPKPLYYAENKERFSKFNDRIIHIVVEDSPNSDNPWVLDRFQKNCIIRGLQNARPDDIILISDADEIPRAETIRDVCGKLVFNNNPFANLFHSFLKSKPTRTIFKRLLRKYHPYVYKLEQTVSCFYLNLVDDVLWYGTRLLFFRDFTLADEIRYTGRKIISNGGWHFTYMGGISRIKQKLQSFAHSEFNKPEFLDDNYLLDCLRKRKIFFMPDRELKVVPIDDRFPKYIQENREKFKDWILPVI